MAENLQARINEISTLVGDDYEIYYSVTSKTLEIKNPENLISYIEQLKEIIPNIAEEIETIYSTEAGINDAHMAAMSQFTNVHTLRLRNNNLTNVGFSELRKFRAIKSLDISNSKQFTPDCLKPILKHVESLSSLSASGIKELDGFCFGEYISLLKNLKSLSISDSGVSVESLKKHILKLSSLESLSLQFITVDEAFGAYILALAKLGKLTGFGSYETTNSGVGKWYKHIVFQIEENRRAKVLEPLTDEMLSELEKAKKLLTEFDKRREKNGLVLGEKAVQDIINLARIYVGKANKGEINFVPGNKAIGLPVNADIKGFFEELKTLYPEIEFVEISAFGLTDESLEAIVKHFPNVERLVAHTCNLTNAGLAHLNGLTNLKELDLGYNKGITSLAAVDFSKLAGSLVKLNLESLDITNKDVANIAKLSGLRELSISRSGINDKGLKELLPKLDKLEVLNISNDARRITPKSAALIYALLEKGTLKKVTCFNFGDKWRRAFSNLELLQSGKHEHLTGLIKDEIAKIFAENPDMQRELDEARALLKAPTPNTHEGGAKIGVEKGKGR